MKKVLIVVDMQNDFIDGALGSEAGKAVVPGVVEKIKNFEGLVYATMDTHRQDYLNSLEGEKLPVVHCVKDTPGWQVNPEVMEALAEKKAVIIEKPSFGSYGLVAELVAALEGEYEEPEFEVCGLVSSICVVSNALMIRACFPDARIKVSKKLTAGLNETNNEAAFEVMRSCQVDVED